MATLTQSYFDLADLYKSQNPDGTVADVINMLTDLTPELDDALAMECNNGAKNVTTILTGLPATSWGRMYKGVPQSKAKRAQIEDSTGFVEGLSTIDERILDLSKNPAQTRLSEAQPYLESLAQAVASMLFYGNTANNPDGFDGLAPRYSDMSADNGKQIIDAGGTGSDNTSIWFVTWGDNQTQLIFPEGTKAGVSREDKGSQRVLDSVGNAYYAKEELFRWHVGLTVKDWRYNSRIANIDVSDVEAGTVDLYGFMRKAYYMLQSRRVPQGKQCIYMNRDMMEALDALATNAGSGDNFTRLRPMEIEGKEVMTYRNIPIRETDALLNTESVVA